MRGVAGALLCVTEWEPVLAIFCLNTWRLVGLQQETLLQLDRIRIASLQPPLAELNLRHPASRIGVQICEQLAGRVEIAHTLIHSGFGRYDIDIAGRNGESAVEQLK